MRDTNKYRHSLRPDAVYHPARAKDFGIEPEVDSLPVAVTVLAEDPVEYIEYDGPQLAQPAKPDVPRDKAEQLPLASTLVAISGQLAVAAACYLSAITPTQAIIATFAMLACGGLLVASQVMTQRAA